jgi:hypothetical protein
MKSNRWLDSVASRVTPVIAVSLEYIDERTLSFARGDATLVLHAYADDRAGFLPWCTGVLASGQRPVILGDYRRFTVGDESVADVADEIIALLR